MYDDEIALITAQEKASTQARECLAIAEKFHTQTALSEICLALLGNDDRIETIAQASAAVDQLHGIDFDYSTPTQRGTRSVWVWALRACIYANLAKNGTFPGDSIRLVSTARENIDWALKVAQDTDADARYREEIADEPFGLY